MKTATVYRFQNYVAVSLPTGETTYILANDAIKLASAIRKCALDVGKCGFLESDFKTQTIELINNGSRYHIGG